MHPLYLDEAGGNGGAGPSAEALLEAALFQGDQGLAALLGGAHAEDALVSGGGRAGSWGWAWKAWGAAYECVAEWHACLCEARARGPLRSELTPLPHRTCRR